MHKLQFKYLVILFFSMSNYFFAQTCGFGCLGLSGFYGGYTYQKYNAEGLNKYLEKSLTPAGSSQVSGINKFEYGTGYRIGANVFRFSYKKFILTIKGYYQFLKEEKKPSDVSNGKYTLTNKYWGTGLDFGYSISSSVDIKFIDAQAIFNSSELKISSTSLTSNSEDSDYSNDKNITGYSIGAGLILKIIDDYLSLEATGGYSEFNIKGMTDEKGNNLLGINNSLADGKDFIKTGGVFVTAQLNIGIPLY
jgi:hypothetical protein